jgi:glycerol-3-phosphate O-acyltransferase/dihydroxyacetone phosphate acyltransferase
MPKLYRGLRLLLRGAVELYYVNIQSTGRELIPAQGPLIFAANHPNSIMDTVILGTQTDRVISYMARSGLFKNPLVAALFNSCGVLPVYRAQDDPAQLHRNEDTFRRAWERLAEGGCIGIFPEGQNSEERAVLELKTGTARIALGAEASRDYQLGLQIVPVGLNFVNRDRFLSRVLVRFGEPIPVQAFAALHREDPRAAARALTDRLQLALRAAATHIEGDLAQMLTNDIYKIYGGKLLDDLAERWDERAGGRLVDELRAARTPRQDLDDVFWVKQRIADAVAWLRDRDPALFTELHNEIQTYRDHLEQVRLRHDFLDRRPETVSGRQEAVKFTLYAVLLAPVALWGLLGNALPYLLTRWFALGAPDEPIRAIRGMAFGAVAFPFFYALEVGWVHALGVSWVWTALLVAVLPPTGSFYLRYRRQLAKYRQRILLRTLFLNNRALILGLAAERQRLLERFDALRARFVEEAGSQMDARLAQKEQA